LKLTIVTTPTAATASPPARGARIETVVGVVMFADQLSPPARGARIETSSTTGAGLTGLIAPRTGGAD